MCCKTRSPPETDQEPVGAGGAEVGHVYSSRWVIRLTAAVSWTPLHCSSDSSFGDVSHFSLVLRLPAAPPPPPLALFHSVTGGLMNGDELQHSETSFSDETSCSFWNWGVSFLLKQAVLSEAVGGLAALDIFLVHSCTRNRNRFPVLQDTNSQYSGHHASGIWLWETLKEECVLGWGVGGWCRSPKAVWGAGTGLKAENRKLSPLFNGFRVVDLNLARPMKTWSGCLWGREGGLVANRALWEAHLQFIWTDTSKRTCWQLLG